MPDLALLVSWLANLGILRNKYAMFDLAIAKRCARSEQTLFCKSERRARLKHLVNDSCR